MFLRLQRLLVHSDGAIECGPAQGEGIGRGVEHLEVLIVALVLLDAVQHVWLLLICLIKHAELIPPVSPLYLCLNLILFLK